MATPPWNELHWQDGFAEARLTLQHAAQLVAAPGQSMLPRAPDDSQQSLSVAAARGLLLGVPLPGGGLRAGLEPVGLTLLVCDDAGAAIAELPLAGRTRAEALDWLHTALGAHGVDAGTLAVPRHPADFPDHAVAHGAPFGDEPAGRAAVAALFLNTQRLLEEARGQATAPIRLWPHHFDLGCSLQRGSVSLGLGVSSGDGAAGSPYWYVTPWPHPPLERLPPLGGSATWHVAGWVGGELPFARLASGAQAQRAQVEALFRSVLRHVGPEDRPA